MHNSEFRVWHGTRDHTLFPTAWRSLGLFALVFYQERKLLAVRILCFVCSKSGSSSLRAVHLSRDKWQGGLVN